MNIEKDEEENNNEIEIEKKELFPGIILIKEYQQISDIINFPDIEGIYTFKIQLNTMSLLHFDLYLDNSRNIILENNESKDQYKSQNVFYTKTTIYPYETKKIAKILLKKNWKLKTKFKINLEIPSKSIQYQYIEKDEQTIKNQLISFRESLSQIPFEFLTQNEINQKFKELKIKFIDIDFPPVEGSITGVSADKKNIDFNSNLNLDLDYIIHWRRPQDYINNETIESLNETNNVLRIFDREKEPEPNDIRQGLLSFSLLDSCVSALTEKYNLIKRLFITKNINEYGIYKIKLCHNGQWKTIFIDDYFPCIPCSSPIVSKSATNELYILLLQKALAKLYGCYNNLSSIKLSDFFHKLTGCPSISIKINKKMNFDEKKNFFNKIKDYSIDKKYIVVAISHNSKNDTNIDNNNDNICTDLTLPYFGYTIIDIKDKYDPNVIILRKVWYNEKREKNIDNYNNKIIKEFPTLINDLNDNSLMLTYEKFISEFNELVICFVKKWEEIRLRGKFINIKDNTISIPISKWYYSFNLTKQTNLIISIFLDSINNNFINNNDDDNNTNMNQKQNNLFDISLTLLKHDLEKNEINLIQTYDFTITSTIQIELNLPAGNYIIYPRTSGCFFPNNAFNINNNNKCEKNEKSNIYNFETKSFSYRFINIIKEIFKKYDIYLNNCLDYEAFNMFYKNIKNNNDFLTEKQFNIDIISKYQSYNKCITEKGFIDFFKYNYLKQNGEKEIKIWLENLGYNEQLISTIEKSFVITFHSDNEIKIKILEASGTDLASKIEKNILKHKGEIIKNKNNTLKNVSVFKYKAKNSNFISYGVLNNDVIPLRIILNFKENENIFFSGNSNYVEKVVQPGKFEFYLNLWYLNLNDNKNEPVFDFNVECYSL